MHSINATFIDGRFDLEGPVDWPDGTAVKITPVSPSPAAKKNGWPEGYFEQTAGALAGEPFERPSQG